MSQNSTVIPTTGTLAGLSLVQRTNAAFDSIISQFSGAAAPATPTTWQLWADTTTNILRIYNGTSWLPIGSFSGSQWVPLSNGVRPTAITTSGSANAYVLTYSPAPAALVVGQIYPAIANFTNTGSATLNINSLGVHNITQDGTTALAGGDIQSGQVFLVAYDGAGFQIVSPPSSAAAFAADKNGTDQTGIPSGTSTKITFTNELFDTSGDYDAANSKWTPPAGLYVICAGLGYSAGIVDQSVVSVQIRKNGAAIYETKLRASGASGQGPGIAAIVQANGTDFFEIYAFADGAGNKTVSGVTFDTFFQGYRIGR